MKYIALAWILLLLMTTPQVAIAKPVAVAIDGGYELLLELPEDFILEKTMGHDFCLYTVSKGGEAYLGVYVGNHPNFPIQETKDGEVVDLDICVHKLSESERIQKKAGQWVSDVKIRSCWRQDNLSGRELLGYVQRPELNRLPVYFHVWTVQSLQANSLQTADRILFSVKVFPERR